MCKLACVPGTDYASMVILVTGEYVLSTSLSASCWYIFLKLPCMQVSVDVAAMAEEDALRPQAVFAQAARKAL